MNIIKLNNNYLLFFTFIPFGIDILLSKLKFSYLIFGKPLFSIIYTFIFIILSIYFFIKSNNNSVFKINKIWFFLLIFLVFLIALSSGISRIGYFSFPLLLLSIFVILKYPNPESIEISAKLFIYLLSILVLLSLLLTFVPGSSSLTSHQLRWAHFFLPEWRRVQGVFSGPGIFGMVCAIITAYSCTLKRNLIIFFSLGVVGLYLADSRAAFVAVFTSALLLYAMSFNKSNVNYISRKALYVLFFSFFIYIALCVFSGVVYGYEDRIRLWSNILHSGSMNVVSSDEFSHAHSLFLDILTYNNFGIQFLYFVILLIPFVLLSYSVKFRLTLPIVFGCTVLIFSLFDYGIIIHKLNIATFSLVICLLAAYRSDQYINAISK